MTEEPKQHDAAVVSVPFYRNQIVLFITGSVVIAFVLVLISMSLYISSGAAQLDLSRPGFKSVQNQLDRTDNFESFPATGPVTNNIIDQFKKLFERQVKPVGNADAFSPAALDDSALGIDAPSDNSQ